MYRYIVTLVLFSILIEEILLSFTIKDYYSEQIFILGAVLFLISLMYSISSNCKRTFKGNYLKVTVLLFACLLAFNVGMIFLNDYANLGFTENQITKTYIKNHEEFDIVVNYLEKKDDDNFYCIYQEDKAIVMYQQDKDYNRVQLKINDSTVNDSLIYIFNKLGYKEVSKLGKEINFLLHPVQKENGYDDGIAYYKGKIITDGMRNQSYKKIVDNWYYFFTGYT